MPANRSSKQRTAGSRARYPFRRRVFLLLVLLGAYSLYQLLALGELRWPGELAARVGTAVGDYADRPQAGWRRAGAALDQLGASREGAPPPAPDLVGRVVRVADGDTVSVLDTGNRQHKVRLFGIDTPERDQPHFAESRAALAALVSGREVAVTVVERDDYGRLVGTLYRGDRNINLAQVAGGNAWWYRYYAPHESALREAEQAAREQRLGLWAAPAPVPPWEWRRGRR